MAIRQFEFAAKLSVGDLAHNNGWTCKILKIKEGKAYVDFDYSKEWLPLSKLKPGPGPGYIAPRAVEKQPKRKLDTEFTKKMIADLAEFQNYGGSGTFKKLGDRLLSHPWPARFTKVTDDVYRIMCLPGKVFDEILAGKRYAVDHASSWTLDKKVAYDFLSTHWFQDYAGNLHEKGKDPVVFILQVKPKGKVLNIDALHKDKAFKAAREFYEDEGANFNEGLDFGSSQREVAIPSYVISKAAIIDYATEVMTRWSSGKKF